MNRWIFSLFPLLLAIAPASAQTKGTNYAFLVACSGYDQNELPKLPFTVKEMGEFKAVLEQTGYEAKNVKFLRDGAELRFAPERAKIVKELENLLARVEANDTLLVALNGHGVHFKNDKSGYFCPLDANLLDKKTMIGMDEEADGLFALLKKCKAKRKLLIVNACRNDPSNFGLAARKVEFDNSRDEELPEGIVGIYSCKPGQRSYYYNPDDPKSPSKERSLFFHNLIEGWSGKHSPTGKVTLEEVFKHVKDRTASEADDLYGRIQVPDIKREYNGEWVIARGSGAPRENPVDGSAKFIKSKTFPDMKLMRIPAGSFTMGSPETEKDRSKDEVQHRVTLSKDFYMGEHTVTVAQWRKFQNDTGHDAKAGAKPPFDQGDDHPVVNVNHDDALAFCKWLSGKDGREYVLPTESQWEYACRAETKSPFWFGEKLNGKEANCNGEYPYGTDEKGPYLKGTTSGDKYKANPFGLYDMHGNVYQWCSDWYGDYLSGSVTDPTGAEKGSYRVLRGGGWGDSAGGCRSAIRDGYGPSLRYQYFGFRLSVLIR